MNKPPFCWIAEKAFIVQLIHLGRWIGVYPKWKTMKYLQDTLMEAQRKWPEYYRNRMEGRDD